MKMVLVVWMKYSALLFKVSTVCGFGPRIDLLLFY